MNLIAISAVIGVISLISVVLATSRQSMRKKLADRDKRDVIHTKVTATRIWKLCVASIFLAPVPFYIVLSQITEQSSREVVLAGLVFLLTGGWGSVWMFWSLAGSAQAELEFRDENIHKDVTQ